MVRKILEAIVGAVLFGPFAVTLFLALAGAVAALVGGLSGWEDLRTTGGAVSGFGALGFFAWFFIAGYFRLFDILNLFTPTTPNGPAQSNVSQANVAQTKAGLSNNGRSI